MEIRVAVPAAITKLAPAESPASITVISQTDIALTPARNLYDLIEIYVPGAIWMNHEQGPHPGVRGNIVNRNYKFLLLVNNRLMNSKEHYGAKSELEQWDLSDIQKIEIVRGPGSVTYGPGAVAGVIKITTHNGITSKGKKLTASYVSKYHSMGLSFSDGLETENLNFYTFVSTTRTEGFAARQFIATDSAEAGYVGDSVLPDSEALDYYADYQDEPQVKLYWQLDYLKQWTGWIRYTQQGSTWRGNEVKSDFNGELINQQSLRDRQWTVVLENDTALKNNLDLTTMFSVDSFDVERRRGSVRNPDPDHPMNFSSNYSEDEILLRSILNWEPARWVEIAIGLEYSHDRFGPAWGDSEYDMILGDDGIIVNGPDSRSIGATGLNPAEAIYVGDGWSTNTYSLFGESNFSINPEKRLLLSGRLDKNTKSDLLFSPRAAYISRFENNHILKIILQQSQRMNTAGQNLINEMRNEDPHEETLTNLEFAYTGKLSDSLTLKLANFWNDAEVVAWGTNSTSLRDESLFIGDLKLYGFEMELFYKWPKRHTGINYSFVKQLDWDLNDELTSSGISYSDYDQLLRSSSAVMQDSGNDLNNWPNQAIKFFGRFKLTTSITWHIDVHVFWDYQGAKDGLDSLRDSVQGQPEQAAVEAALDKIDSVDTYDYDFRLNSAVSYVVKKKIELRLFVQNMLGSNRNKRYAYDTGINRASPHRTRFVEEPRTVGVTAEYRF